MSKTVTLQPIEPMEARSVEALPEDDGWQFEPKWDGFRCIAVRQGDGWRCSPNPASRWGGISPKWWR